jgi:L-threonylcarbamoyladenylate synthase
VTTTAVPGEPDPREAAETEVQARYRRFDCTASDPSSHTEATEAAGKAIEAGECIVLPTDTVYGIGVDAFSAGAVQRLLDAKQRGRDMPPPVLIGEPTLIKALAVDVPESSKDLVDKHWPGALTVICRIQPSLRMDLGDTEGTIALRVPDHELAREILRRTGPLAVSSANISGRPAALTCDEAIEQLGDSVAVYLDGGPLGGGGGAPSTIVDFTRHEYGQVLRRGAISVETLRETAPNLRDLSNEAEVAEDRSAADSGSVGDDSGRSNGDSAPAAGG